MPEAWNAHRRRRQARDFWNPAGSWARAVAGAHRAALTAEQGMRVLAVGAQDFTAEAVEAGDPKDLLDRIVLVARVGIVDPPRPEARKAIRNAATRASVSG